ncbi:lipopolysaccharide biosynthesis protein [Sphingobacterium gobiense]|nr:lipopolysaccharide biosynthesis protein [Sphingobacterium gobiense]
MLAGAAFFLLETVGLWFMNYRLNIPLERMFAANVVFQFSVLSFIVNIISIPYNALIIASEKMNIIAYVGVLEASLKILLIFLLGFANSDRLVLFAVLMFIVALIVRIIFQVYSRRTFKELEFKAVFDKQQIKVMLGFAGWNFIGSASGVLKDQGINVVLNLIYGVTINAARGIVLQIESAVNQFVVGFTTSFNPQIVKSYASRDYSYTYTLVFNGCRFAFFLMLIVAFPIILNAEWVLNIWLVKVPDYTLIFTQLSLIYSLILSISYPLITLNMATGKIKIYQLLVGGAHFLNFPISYFLLNRGGEPYVIYIVAIILNIVCLVLRVVILKFNIGLSVYHFFKLVLLNIMLVLLIAVPIPVILKSILTNTLLNDLILFITTFLISLSAVFIVGLSASERIFLINMVKLKLRIK